MVDEVTRAQTQLARAWSGVQRRAAIFEYPVREMQGRGWIETTNDIDRLESELCRFFCASSVADISMERLTRSLAGQ